MLIKRENVLDSLDTWKRLAGPKSGLQWQEYRSAEECAIAWLSCGGTTGIPDELLNVLGTHRDFGRVIEWNAEPECLVPFDEYGGPANIDVLLSGRDDLGSFVMAVEAKADEPFGSLVGRALTDAVERWLTSSSSKGVARLEGLAKNILGAAIDGRPQLHQIRYQLLTLTAAALSKAKEEKATRAVVMIHEFETPRTVLKNRTRNSGDLTKFLKRLGSENANRVLKGELVGPLHLPGGARFVDPPPLYVGKATRLVQKREGASKSD